MRYPLRSCNGWAEFLAEPMKFLVDMLNHAHWLRICFNINLKPTSYSMMNSVLDVFSSISCSFLTMSSWHTIHVLRVPSVPGGGNPDKSNSGLLRCLVGFNTASIMEIKKIMKHVDNVHDTLCMFSKSPLYRGGGAILINLTQDSYTVLSASIRHLMKNKVYCEASLLIRVHDKLCMFWESSLYQGVAILINLSQNSYPVLLVYYRI